MEAGNHKTTGPVVAQVSILQHPVAVDFIENCLPSHHPAFQKPPAHFDTFSRWYIATPPQEIMQTMMTSGVLVDAMPFWNEMFSDAVTIFTGHTTEPKELKEPAFKIRSAHSWNEVQTALQKAQDHYVKETGVRGWMRQSRRAIADNSQVAVQAWKIVPNVEVTSPVIGVVQGLLEVSGTARHCEYDTHDVSGHPECSQSPS